MCYSPMSPSSFTPLHLYVLLEAHGVFLLWGPGYYSEKGEIQEDSGRSEEGFVFSLFLFRQESYFAFGSCGCFGRRTLSENFLCGLCFSPITRSSFFNANFPSRAAIASWSVKGSDVTTEHHSFATVLLSRDSSMKKA